MDLYQYFLIRFDLKNEALKPYYSLFNLSRDSYSKKKQPYCLIYKALSLNLC